MSIEVVTPNGVKKVRGVEVFGTGGGGSGILPPHLDIFSHVITPIISVARGVSILSGEIQNNACNLSFSEYSAGFEGFNIQIPTLTIGKSYIINFDFQFTQAIWFAASSYRTGVKVFDTNYDSYNDTANWPENIDRDLLKHNHQITFTATAETMYLSFNLCGCADAATNYFEITDFYVQETSQ